MQDGLIALWDGINNANTADGAHDSSAKTWADLCGGEGWALASSAGWTADFALNCPGTVRAPSAGNGTPTGLGGGGRIAVHYDVEAQKYIAKPTISFDVSSGTQYARNEKALQYHNSSQNRGECGTVYFPDDQLLHWDPINVSGQIYMDEPKWSVPSLGIYDRTVMFPQDGFELTVAGNVVVSGGVARAAGLYIGGDRRGADRRAECGVRGRRRDDPYRCGRGVLVLFASVSRRQPAHHLPAARRRQGRQDHGLLRAAAAPRASGYRALNWR